MPRMTASEWIRTITPIIVLAAGGLIGWVRLDAKLETTVEGLRVERERSMEVDKAQDTIQMQTQISVVEIKADLKHIKEGVDRNARTQEAILLELRK